MPDQGLPVLASSNSSFVIQTIAAGGGAFSLGASNIGNTLGDTGVTGSRVVLAGIGNLTLSQATDANGGTISISGGTAGAGGVAISASNSLFSTGTVVLSGAGGGATVNTNGNTIQISVAAPVAQTVQTQNRFNLTLDGNTAGALQEVSSGTLTLAGGNGVTLSQNGNAITISGNTFSQSVQPETQTFVGGVIASNTTYTSGSVRFTGVGGGVTVSSNTGQRVDISVAAQSVQTQNMVAITLSGNTSGAQALISSGTLTLAGGNNITVSQNGNAVTISGPNVGGAQTGISGIIASDATYTSGTVQFTGSNMITVKSSANQRVVIDATQSVQPGIQNLVASDTTFSSGTVSISGFGAVTVNTAANIIRISAPVQTAQTGISGIANSQTTYTSGTVSLSELGAITIRSTTGNQFQFSVAAQTAESQSIGMSNLGNTSGTTGIASGAQVRMLFAGGNNVTLSQSLNGASGTITISAFNQTGTQFSAGISGGNTSGDTGTVAGRVVFAGGNNITLSGSTNGVSETITVSAAAQTVESQSIGASNLGNTLGTSGVASGGQVRAVIIGTSNITVSQSVNGASATLSLIGQPAFSAGVSTGGNTGGATGVTGTNIVLVGSNNITLSQTTGANGGTVSIFGPSPGAAQYSIGVSTGGNTQGNTGVTGTRIVFAGTNNITLSQATDATGATISISGAPSFSAGVSTGGNTAGATGLTGTQMVWVGSSPISLSQTTGANGGTITINAPATSSLIGVSGISISTNGSTISVFPTPRTSFTPHDEVVTITGQQGQGSLHIQPMHPPHLQYDRMLLSYQISNASNSSNSFTLSNWVGIYTRNASTLSLVSSISTSTNFTGSGTVGSYSLYGGLRQLSIPWTMTLTDGDYWIGIVTRTTTGGGAGHTLNQIVKSAGATVSSNVTAWSGLLGAANGQASVQQIVGLGTYSVSTSGIPGTIAFSEITGTGTLPMNVPLFQFRSGTV